MTSTDKKKGGFFTSLVFLALLLTFAAVILSKIGIAQSHIPLGKSAQGDGDLWLGDGVDNQLGVDQRHRKATGAQGVERRPGGESLGDAAQIERHSEPGDYVRTDCISFCQT